MFELPFLFLFLALFVLLVLVSPVVVLVDETFALAPPLLGVLDLFRLQAPKETARHATIVSRNTVSVFRMTDLPNFNWYIIV